MGVNSFALSNKTTNLGANIILEFGPNSDVEGGFFQIKGAKLGVKMTKE